MLINLFMIQILKYFPHVNIHTNWYVLILFLFIIHLNSCTTKKESSMTPIGQAITGSEKRSGKNNPKEALIEFYDAFNNRNLDLMQKNWANTDEIAMDNPLGGIMRGWEDIYPVYQRIFEGKAKVYVEYYDYTIHEGADLFYAVGRERGYFKIGDQKIDLKIRTSRIFKKINNEWRQVHHHGSIEDPALLLAYQNLVNNKSTQSLTPAP